MSWQLVRSFELSNEWQFTQAIAGQYFRVQCLAPPPAARLLIAQAQTIGDLILYDVHRLSGKSESVLEFIAPPEFTRRRIALKKSRLSPVWTVLLEVSDEVVPHDLAEHLAAPNPHPQYFDKQYQGYFSQDDLSIAGVLGVKHNLETVPTHVGVWDESGVQVIPDRIDFPSPNNTVIHLESFQPIPGTWFVLIGGSSS